MADNYVLKDELFNRETVSELASSIKKVYEDFECDVYIEECVSGFDSRELKERMTFMAEKLEDFLPSDYLLATDIMLKACQVTKGKESFVYGAFSEYVEKHGCNEKYLDHSLIMLGEYTKVFSAEFAIRAFINDFPEQSFKQMLEWSLSDDFNQRRLSSEGMRPKLPWGKAIDFDPLKAVSVLDNLYDDKERYVTRSVANHLNDLSKIEPDVVVSILSRWQDSVKQEKKEMDYIISHSTRTLVKKGHIGALDLLGYKHDAKFEIDDLRVLTPSIHIGQSLEFEFEIRALEDMKAMIDYQIDYPMAGGKRSSKVFKIKKANLKKYDHLKIHKKHPFKVMTTKKLYTGDYTLTLQINGKLYTKGYFSMEVN
ncbi:DNA alkylation repair protein [Acidaminobacter sp. JC074]|uniref:hypothetical protein n=1 Tax=Acidaminobacter sp. JC074 TaxID=2530199 RepID=UPI001F0FF6E7|nr:hypothetical protein [Acidaminobacter sp. JC074]MCH4888053.1 DNA alkylation repair protein [Acidaminobacter sp. JC074]